MTFDARAHWANAEGTVTAHPATKPVYLRQQAALIGALHGLSDISSILEVGCGNGRIAAVLQQALPFAHYSGVDIGPAQVRRTKEARPDADVFLSAIQDFEPAMTWDLVLTVETLMHVPPDEIQGVVEKLKRLARRFLVSVEWSPSLPPPRQAPDNWPHDYLTLFGPSYAQRTDQQVIYIVEIA